MYVLYIRDDNYNFKKVETYKESVSYYAVEKFKSNYRLGSCNSFEAYDYFQNHGYLSGYNMISKYYLFDESEYRLTNPPRDTTYRDMFEEEIKLAKLTKKRNELIDDLIE